MYLKIQKKLETERDSLVWMDNKCWGVLPDRTLLALYPIPFQGEIEDSNAAELLRLLEQRARELLLKYLAQSEHSSFQCAEYLKRKHFAPAIRDKLVSEYLDQKYIDDERYVRILISSLIARKKSKQQIIKKLREQRLPATIWKEVLNELYNPEDNAENLKEMVLILRLRYRQHPAPKQKEKVFSSLYRKGFSLDDINAAWQATKE